MIFSTKRTDVATRPPRSARKVVSIAAAVVTSMSAVAISAAPAGAAPAAALIALAPGTHGEFPVGATPTFEAVVVTSTYKTVSTGTVSFKVNGTSIAECPPVDLSGGQGAACSFTVSATVTSFTVTASYSGSSSAGPASTTGTYGTWNRPLSLGPAVTSFASTSCTDDGICEAVGTGSTSANGSVSGSTDGGASWALQPLPSGVGPLAGVTCIDSGLCITVGSDGSHSNGRILWTGDAGATWHIVQGGSSLKAVHGLWCGSGSCVFVGGGLNEYGTSAFVALATYTIGSDAGGDPTLAFTFTNTGTLPANLSEIAPSLCPGGKTCFAPGTQLTSVTCASSTKCFAVGSYSFLMCPTSSACASGDQTLHNRGIALVSTNGGVNWKSSTLPVNTGKLASIACPNTSRCYAVGGAIYASTNGGSSYDAQSVNGPVGRFGGVQCQSASTCIASGNRTVTLNGALPWKIRSQPAALAYGASVTCRTNGPCVEVGVSNVLTAATATSSNNGANWTAAAYKPNASVLNAVACPSTSTCIAVGDGAMRTTNGGASYASLSIPVQISLLNGISCPSTTKCVAVGGALGQGQIVTTSNTGSAWSIRSVPSDVSALSAVACPSTSFCLAVGTMVGGGGAVLSSTNGGSTWTEQDALSALSLAGVSCPAINTCVVVGSTPGSTPNSSVGIAFSTTDGGATFNQNAQSVSTVALTSVSCPSMSKCLVGGSSSTMNALVLMSTSSFSSFANATVVSQTQYGIKAVGCANSLACAAVGTSRPYGVGIALSGPPNDLVSPTGGTGVVTAFDGGVAALNGVACASDSICTAVGRNNLGTAVIVQVFAGSID